MRVSTRCRLVTRRGGDGVRDDVLELVDEGGESLDEGSGLAEFADGIDRLLEAAGDEPGTSVIAFRGVPRRAAE